MRFRNNNHMNVEDTVQDVRRGYRENFYTADIGKSISGAILFKETLYQNSSDNTPFFKCLLDRGVLPGIKVDQVL